MMEFNTALKIVKERYSKVIENQEELICLFDKNCTIKDVNDAYCRYFQKTYDELVGISFLELVPKSEHKKIQKELSKISPNNPVAHIVCKLQPNGKSYKWQAWKNIAVFNDKGEIIEFQAVGKDITELKRLQDEIAKLKQQECTNTASIPSFIGKCDGKKVIIKADDICYVKASLVNTEVVTPYKKARVSMQIKDVQKILGNMNFFRIHRSYLVNLDKIKAMESINESKYKISFIDMGEYITSSKRGAKELRQFLKSKN